MERSAPALPDSIDGAERCTALACPDCSGTLGVRSEGGGGYLHFRCRIGHAFSLQSLLACKEEALEAKLWSCVTSMEELAALLRDLQTLADPYGDGSADDAPRRIANLERGVATLREVLDGNAPLALAASDPGRGC